MKRLTLSLFSLFFCTIILAQKTIKQPNNAYAFFKVHLPGRMKVDEENNKTTPKILIERLIYVESNIKSKPIVEKVLYNNKEFKVAETLFVGPKVNVGLKTNSEHPTILNATKNKTFWVLKFETKPMTEKDFGKNILKINITYSVEKVKSTILLKEETELLTPEAQ
jgi:hypothetical protein